MLVTIHAHSDHFFRVILYILCQVFPIMDLGATLELLECFTHISWLLLRSFLGGLGCGVHSDDLSVGVGVFRVNINMFILSAFRDKLGN